MDLNWLKKKLTSNTEPIVMQEKISSMNELLDKTILTIRKIASELRPSILDDLGLYAALEWQSQEFEKRFNIPVQFSTEVNQLEIAPPVASGLFRIYQESLTNIARHAEAKNIVASLQLKDKNLVLTVADDGKGFVVNDDKKTLGLLGMKERALTMGGKIEIKSEPGKGTMVTITVSSEENKEPG
jgi:signal transduction histidine kinase